MDINLVLEIVKYLLFSIFLFSGTFLIYKTITPKEIRDSHRLRFKQQLQTKMKTTEKKLKSISFDERLKEAGLPFMNSFRFEMIRIGILVIFIINYWLLPVLSGEGINIQSISILIVLWLITEHRFNIPVSLTNIILKVLTAQKKKVRSIELFTLYDVLKTELNTLHSNQTVNVYNLLKDSLPMFRYLNGTLSRFLSTLLTNPSLAQSVFYDDIKTQGAKTIGEIIVKIDNLSRDEALEVIQTESSAYSSHFFKQEFRNGQKRKNRLQALFSVNVLFNAAWLIIFITNMLMIQMNNVNNIL